MRLTATELRSRLYKVLDQVAETGEPVEVIRRGRVIRLVAEQPAPRTFSMSRVQPGPGKAIVGDPAELPDIEWSSEWSARLPGGT